MSVQDPSPHGADEPGRASLCQSGCAPDLSWRHAVVVCLHIKYLKQHAFIFSFSLTFKFDTKKPVQPVHRPFIHHKKTHQFTKSITMSEAPAAAHVTENGVPPVEQEKVEEAPGFKVIYSASFILVLSRLMTSSIGFRRESCLHNYRRGAEGFLCSCRKRHVRGICTALILCLIVLILA